MRAARARSRAVFGGVAGAVALALSLLDAPPAAGIGGGAPFGINLVRLEGVLGAERAPGHIMQTLLLVGERQIPFSVVRAQRLSGAPENGVGILLPMGPGEPRIRVVGESAFIKPIESAPAGQSVTIIGNLIVGMRYLELMGVDLGGLSEPSPGAQEHGQDDRL
jgi:hypothetical protein